MGVIQTRGKSLSEIRSEASKLRRTIGGRPRGTKNPQTIEKAVAKALMQQTIMRITAPLVQAQAALAQGLTFLYVIHTDKKGNRSKPEIVTDKYTIESYLAGELEDDEAEYYYMATKEPNNEAIKNLLDRAFDKPSEQQTVDIKIAFDPYALAVKAQTVNQSLPAPTVRLMPEKSSDESIEAEK